MIHITDDITISEDEIHLEFIRASGPGGQNVNKVATAVQLSFDIRRSPSLPAGVRERLQKLAGRRITKSGILVITARRYRTQQQNREDAVDRLVRLVRRAVRQSKPRRKTKPTVASKERRLEEKHRRSELKRLRSQRPENQD